MSLKVMTMCIEAKLGTPTRFAVAMALADHADEDGASIYPSIDRIAEKAKVSRRTAQYTLRKLEDEGLVVVVSEGGRRGRDTREWRFDLEKLSALIPARGAKSAPVEGRKRSTPGVQSTTRRGATGCTLTVKNRQEEEKDHRPASNPRVAASGPAKADEPEIGELNGATTAIVQGVGRWLNNLRPDLPTARRIVASNVALYGADAVRRGFADMQADVIDGKIVGSPLKAFTGYCDKAKTGRTIEKPKARDWHAERKASRERLIAEAKELGRKRAAAQEAAR